MRKQLGIRRFLCIFIGLLLLSATSCREAFEDRDRVLSFLRNLERESREFNYISEENDREVQVKGFIQDAFRYSATLTIDDAQIAEALVEDDALGLRVITPSAFPALAAGQTSTSQILANALTSGQWIVDPAGAPPVVEETSADVGETGVNPLLDAVRVIRYVRLAVTEAASVKEWQEEDIDPAYRPHESNFAPKPAENIGERRFDLVRSAVPRPARSGAQGGGLQDPPQIANFRKMAIYVRNDRVTRVIEEIDIIGHKDFVEARQEQKTAMLELLATILAGTATEDVIAPRKMTVVFSAFGSNTSVKQPADALNAPLRDVVRLPGTRESNEDISAEELEELAGGQTGAAEEPAPAPPAP